MKIKCPDCGSVIDIDRLRSERAFWEIIEVYKDFSPTEAGLIGEYVDCFRASAHADISPKKHLRILKEILALIKTGKFSYNRRTYGTDRAIIFEAIQKTIDTEKRAFTNHNYLKAIMIGLLKKRNALDEKETEETRRDESEARSHRMRRDNLPERGVPMPDWVKKEVGL